MSPGAGSQPEPEPEPTIGDYTKDDIDEFTKSFVEKTKKLKIGNGLTDGVQLGPMTTKKRLEEIEQMVETTKKEGAKI